MWNSKDGSTGRLIQLCIGYFFFYVITGIAVKYFIGYPINGSVLMTDMEYLVYNTAGGNMIALATVLILGWYKIHTNNYVNFFSFKVPSELIYIIPSGICTAIVIPTTTLMYTLPITVMVAMVIMRGSIIVISRIIDAVQIKQGILKKKVYWEENVAVLFAVIAVAANLISVKPGSFDFIHNAAAVTILSSYLIAYTIRIYIMNYYKNTRGKNVKQDNKGFFAIEQIAATTTMIIIGLMVYFYLSKPEMGIQQAENFRHAIDFPKTLWFWASISGFAFGIVAFFSVFIFMFKGRTATFAGLVNRLTSLVAGTIATLIFAFMFGGKYPVTEDWVTMGFILVSVAFLTRAEKKRSRELVEKNEI
ncbi:hypothetical protein BH10BAC5_BH10BAC5_10430 [soil metagenome]